MTGAASQFPCLQYLFVEDKQNWEMKWLQSVVGQIAGCGIFHRKCNIQSEATATVYLLTENEGRTHLDLFESL